MGDGQETVGDNQERQSQLKGCKGIYMVDMMVDSIDDQEVRGRMVGRCE